MDPAVIALTFAAIFVVELPDKTFLATLVLATKYRPILVWIGVCAAFLVQTVVAVALGHAASFLPGELVAWLAAALFAFGAIVLFREGRSHEEDSGEEYAEKAKAATGFKAILASFLVLFVAEWGDLSQLLTMSLVAKYEEPIAVFIGAFAALATVSGLAVLVGRALLKKVSLHILHYIGAAICALLCGLTVWEILG